MTDAIEKAYLEWVKNPDAPVTSQSIFKAGYLAGCAQAIELRERVRVLEQENQWLESHGKDWGCQVIK